jgi:protein phosphatase
MQYWSVTDPGCVRASNQDAIAVEKLDKNHLLCVICDGMGGAKSGNVASSLASEVFVQEVKRTWKADMEPDKVDLMLQNAVKLANFTVYDQSRQFEEFSGMGTTLVAALVQNKFATFVNVGDSRLYLVEAGEIEQVTHDHSQVQDMIDFGTLTPEEAKHHMLRNVITRAVGTRKTVDADLFVCEMKPGTYAVLCSDGLTNHVEPEEICETVGTIGQTATIEEACAALIDCANSRGGHDNITAVILST